MKNFIPHIFISIGEHNHLFTLRKTALATIYDGYGRPRTTVTSFHVQNLSQKLPEALDKAKQYAKDHAVVFSYDPERDHFPQDLDEIRRLKKAEREAKKAAKIAEEKRRQEEYEENRRLRMESKKKSLDDGIWSFGKHEGRKIEDFPSYAAFLVSKKSEFEKGSILEYAVQVLETKFKHVLDDEGFNQGYLPDAIGSKVEVKGKVKKVLSFNNCFDGWRTTVSYWVFIKTDEGLCVVTRGSWIANEGDTVHIRGTIKNKEEYKGQTQTIINRVKVV